MTTPKPPADRAQALIAKTKALVKTGTEWRAREAIGDAVLLVLRDRDLTRETLREQLQAMAEGRVAEWEGFAEVAGKAAEFIDAPPPTLPQWRAEE